MHFWYTPVRDGKPAAEFKAGETRRQRFKITGRPAAEAAGLMADSKLLPCFDPDKERPYYVNGVNRFDKGGNVEETSGRLVWEGGAQWDRTVGRGDSSSMRMENKASLSVFIGYNGASAEARKTELSAWVKTEESWQGNGVRLGINGKSRYSYADTEWGEWTPPQTGEWRRIAYEIPFPTPSLVIIRAETSGQGVLWIDDVEYKKLDE